MMLVIFCVRIWSEHHCAGTTSVDLGEPIDSSLLFGMKAAAFIGFDKLAPRSSSLRSAGPARDFSLLGCHDAARSE